MSEYQAVELLGIAPGKTINPGQTFTAKQANLKAEEIKSLLASGVIVEVVKQAEEDPEAAEKAAAEKGQG
ncbi:MAG: hypothetical protein ACNA7T_10290 [Haliea sp.]